VVRRVHGPHPATPSRQRASIWSAHSVNLVSDDGASPVKGCRLEGIRVRDGGIQITDDPARFETYAGMLTRLGLEEMTIEAESAPPVRPQRRQ
jgi:hypothetical protein